LRYSVLSKYRPQLMGAAMLWVMLFHAYDLDLGHWLLNWLRAAGFGGVDIFILLSSMGLVMSLARRKQEYGAFMARRLGRILPAYYLVMVPYTLCLIAGGRAVWSTLVWNCLLVYYWVRPVGAFNWYVAGALTFYSVTPLCFRAMGGQSPEPSGRSLRRRGVPVTAAGILAGLAVCQVLMRDGYWQMMDIMYRVPTFFLGLLMGFWVLEDRRLGWRDILFWWLSLGAGVLYLCAVYGEWEHVLAYPLCHLFLFTTVPMCLAVCWCFERLPLGWPQKFLGFVGENSLEIYLLNVSLFSEVELLRRFVSFGPSNRMYYLLSFAVNIALGVLLHKAVERLKGYVSKRRSAAGGD